ASMPRLQPNSTTETCIISGAVVLSAPLRPHATLARVNTWRSSMSDKIVHTSDADFEKDVLKSDKPVLVDYWAEWCGPCKMIAPILDEIADEYADKVKICKLDIDANQETPPKYGIKGIPTLMLFKNGEVEATKVGAMSKSQLAAFLDSNI